jgi:hypothetical protein
MAVRHRTSNRYNANSEINTMGIKSGTRKPARRFAGLSRYQAANRTFITAFDCCEVPWSVAKAPFFDQHRIKAFKLLSNSPVCTHP